MGATSASDSNRGGRRLPVLQVLVVFAIVAAVVAIGLPAFAARAKGAVLTQNVQGLPQQVREQLVASGGANVQARELCVAIADAARLEAVRPYINPLSGSRAVVYAEPDHRPRPSG